MPQARNRLFCLLLTIATALNASRLAVAAEPVATPYGPQQAVLDFYFDTPEKIGTALYWLRALMNPLTVEPYGYAPEELDIKVIIHGTEIVTLAKANYERYREAVERMRYYASLGVEFRVCAMAMADYGYTPEELQDFVLVVPSAITDIAHWQLEGYALIHPRVLEKQLSIEEIR